MKGSIFPLIIRIIAALIGAQNSIWAYIKMQTLTDFCIPTEYNAVKKIFKIIAVTLKQN